MRAFLHNRLGRFIQSRTLQVHAHRRAVQFLPKSRAAATNSLMCPTVHYMFRRTDATSQVSYWRP